MSKELDTEGRAPMSGADGDFISGTENGDTLWGTPGDDTIWGDRGDDLIKGKEGDDSLKGGSGDDTIFGGSGNDTIRGHEGNDLLKGEEGDDNVWGGDGNDTLVGGEGEDKLFGQKGDDLIIGGPDDYVDGGKGYDTLKLDGQLGNVKKITITNEIENEDGTISYDGYVEYLDGSKDTRFVSIEKIIPCFTPGTLIATPEGERLVETLQEGDKIITRDNGIQEIRWAGKRRMDWNALAANAHLKPILIEKGALGNGLPERDMLVSPQHRMLVANERTALYFDEHEVLVAAKHLLNHKGVREVDSLGVTYIHFMCERHEVVLSNGSWSETFQPGDYTLKGMGNAQRLELFQLFPELQTPEGRENYGAARKTLKRHEARLLAS